MWRYEVAEVSQEKGSPTFRPSDAKIETKAKELVTLEFARQLAAQWTAGEEFKDFDFVSLDEFYEQPEHETHFRVGSEHGDKRHGLWPSNGTVLLAAQAKAGKTTLLLNLIYSLVTGEKFLGRFDVTGLGPDDKAVILNLEVNDDQYRRWQKSRGIPNDPRVMVANLRGKANNVNLLDRGIRKLFVEKLQATGANILIVDPIGPIMRAIGVDEQDNSTVGRVLDAFNELRVDTNIKDIFLIHHAGHAIDSQKSRPGGSRGASAFNDIPDALWTYGIEKDNPGVRYLTLQGRDVFDEGIEVKFDEDTRTLTSSGFKLVADDADKDLGVVQPKKSSRGRRAN